MTDESINELVEEYFYRGYEWDLSRGLPLPPLLPLDVMIQRNAELRKIYPDAIPSEEQRLAAKVSEEFVL